MPSDKWKFYVDKRGGHRWRRTASNGVVVGSSTDGFSRKNKSLRNAQRHGYQGNPNNYGASDKWEIYQDRRGKYRWRRKATNGEIMGASTHGFVKRVDCCANAVRNGWAS